MSKKTNKIIVILSLLAMVFAANTTAVKASILETSSDSDFTIPGSGLDFAYSAINLSIQAAGSGNDNPNSAVIESDYLVRTSPTAGLNSGRVKTGMQSWAEELSVLATGYSSTPDQTDASPFITAWGTHVRDGIIAANFSINGKKIPLGTKVKIPEIYGNRIFVIEDRMNSRYTNNIDIWFPTRSNALNFGAKRVKVEIVNS